MTTGTRRMIGLGLCALLTAPAIPGSVSAQTAEEGSGVAVYVGAGVARLSTQQLTARLIDEGYPSFGTAARSFHLGGYFTLGSGIMMGAELNGVAVDDGEREGLEVGLGGGYGTLGVGYAHELSPRLRIYPRLGFGGGGITLRIASPRAEVDFDDVLAEPQRERLRSDSTRATLLGTGSAVVDLGAGAEFLPGGWGRGLLVGLRAGYAATPFSDDWYLQDTTISDGPSASVAGPYLRLVIGGYHR